MTEDKDKLERVEEVVKTSFKLTRYLRRAHNRVTKIFDDNFEAFEEEIKRNSANIDKIVKTLQELMGEKDVKYSPEKEEDEYTERLYQ